MKKVLILRGENAGKKAYTTTVSEGHTLVRVFDRGALDIVHDSSFMDLPTDIEETWDKIPESQRTAVLERFLKGGSP